MTTPTTELLPCPFCGGTKLESEHTESYVFCRGCRASGPYTSKQSRAASVEAWNERALLARLGEQQPVAWLWQHEETGRTGFVDAWQVENGWQEANPRNKMIRPVYDHPSPAPVGAKEREAFEAYFASSRRSRGKAKAAELLVRMPGGDYVQEHTQRHWWTWQQALAARSAAQGAALKTLPEQPDMGEGWSVTVCRHGVAELTISDEHYSGSSDLDEALIVGAAKHLLSFVGYGLPPCSFDPDEAAQGAVQVPAVTDAMVAAYLAANTAYWQEVDAKPFDLTKPWRQGTPSDATRVSLEAALRAAAPAHAGERSEGGA